VFKHVEVARRILADGFVSVSVEYDLVANGFGVLVVAALMAAELLRGLTDPTCRMKTKRRGAIRLDSKHHLRARGLEPPGDRADRHDHL
jgi:hypothetical protein